MDQTTFWEDEMTDTDLEDMLMIVSSTSEKKKSNDYNPSCIVRILSEKIVYCKWNNIKKEILLSFRRKPSLFLFFHPLNYYRFMTIKSCPCSDVIGDITIITVNATTNVENKKQISCLYIPTKPDLYIHPYYFLPKKQINKSCRISTLNNSEQNTTILTPSDMVLKLFDNNLNNVCLILLSDFHTIYDEMVKFAKCLKDFDQTKQIPVIGGTVNELLLCNPISCRVEINGVIFAIKSNFLKAWTLSLNVSCRTEEKIRMKFVEFKDRVELKKYSFGYMFYSTERIQSLINLEKKIFKETFPKVDLFTIHGFWGYASDDLNEIFPLTQKSAKMVFDDEQSHFMIITYN